MVLDCFGVARSTYYRWKNSLRSGEAPISEIEEKIEELCLKCHFIYGYRTIKRLLLKKYGLIVNAKKVYRIVKNNSWLCRTRIKKSPRLGIS